MALLVETTTTCTVYMLNYGVSTYRTCKTLSLRKCSVRLKSECVQELIEPTLAWIHHCIYTTLSNNVGAFIQMYIVCVILQLNQSVNVLLTIYRIASSVCGNSFLHLAVEADNAKLYSAQCP